MINKTEIEKLAYMFDPEKDYERMDFAERVLHYTNAFKTLESAIEAVIDQADDYNLNIRLNNHSIRIVDEAIIFFIKCCIDKKIDGLFDMEKAKAVIDHITNELGPHNMNRSNTYINAVLYTLGHVNEKDFDILPYYYYTFISILYKHDIENQKLVKWYSDRALDLKDKAFSRHNHRDMSILHGDNRNKSEDINTDMLSDMINRRVDKRDDL